MRTREENAKTEAKVMRGHQKHALLVVTPSMLVGTKYIGKLTVSTINTSANQQVENSSRRSTNTKDGPLLMSPSARSSTKMTMHMPMA